VVVVEMTDDNEQVKQNFVDFQNKGMHDINLTRIKGIILSQGQDYDPELKTTFNSLNTYFTKNDIGKYNETVSEFAKEYPNKLNSMFDSSAIEIASTKAEGFYLIDSNPTKKGEVNYPDFLINKEGAVIVQFSAVYEGKNEKRYNEVLRQLGLLEEKDSNGKWHIYEMDLSGNPKKDKRGNSIDVPFMDAYIKIIEKMPEGLRKGNEPTYNEFKTKYEQSKRDIGAVNIPRQHNNIVNNFA